MRKYDLIVVGGGISGVAAAVAGAREGLKTLLIEKSGVLGGAMSLSLVYPFMKYKTETRRLSDGIFHDMCDRWEKYGEPSFESYKAVFDDMLSEAGADVLFHSTVCEASADGRDVRSVKVATKAGMMEFLADSFIDATGDGELFSLLGCDYQLGRDLDGFCQPMTTCFRVSGVDVDAFFLERRELLERYKEYQSDGRITNPRENILVFRGLGEGILHFNTTRVVKHDPTDPFSISEAEMIARRQVFEMMRFLRENTRTFDNAAIVSISNHIGVRESRRLRGVHVLTAEEIKNCVYFDDAIALGNYEIDIHSPTGSGTELYYFHDEEFYSIPYRSLLPCEYDNLLVAGRCLSATHEAHSAVRIMPICACLGEAAGTAMAVAKADGKNAATLDTDRLRARLTENGAAV